MDGLDRALLFIVLLALLVFLQKRFPLKKDNLETPKRFIQNFSHVLLSQTALFIFFLVIGKSFFVVSNSLKIGLFYQFEGFVGLKFFVVFMVFDLALYLQHYVSHRWQWFWKIHRMHHSDKMLTTSTAVRFHFLEIIISAVWKGVVIILLGASLKDFVYFEAFLSSCALFNHSNLKLPQKWTKPLGKILVTPGLHRIHHSTDLSLTHSNFGFSVIVWDKIFKTFNESLDVLEVGVQGLNGESFKTQILLRNV